MIGLVFSQTRSRRKFGESHRPPTGEPVNGRDRPTQPSSSWWVGVTRDAWAAKVLEEWFTRLRYQKSIPEPTARKEVPAWARKTLGGVEVKDKPGRDRQRVQLGGIDAGFDGDSE